MEHAGLEFEYIDRGDDATAERPHEFRGDDFQNSNDDDQGDRDDPEEHADEEGDDSEWEQEQCFHNCYFVMEGADGEV